MKQSKTNKVEAEYPSMRIERISKRRGTWER
jgi:hypothetical protein